MPVPVSLAIPLFLPRFIFWFVLTFFLCRSTFLFFDFARFFNSPHHLAFFILPQHSQQSSTFKTIQSWTFPTFKTSFILNIFNFQNIQNIIVCWHTYIQNILNIPRPLPLFHLSFSSSLTLFYCVVLHTTQFKMLQQK